MYVDTLWFNMILGYIICAHNTFLLTALCNILRGSKTSYVMLKFYKNTMSITKLQLMFEKEKRIDFNQYHIHVCLAVAVL